jgi:hypothetical protein
VAAIAARREPGWRLLLIAALAELAIGWVGRGFAAGLANRTADVGRRGTVVHGVAEISSASLVRKIGRRVEARRA